MCLKVLEFARSAGVQGVGSGEHPKGRHQLKKNVFFWALPESPKPPPPPSPQFGQLGPFFSDVKRFPKMWGGEGGNILTT